jgi:hypothetical protein
MIQSKESKRAVCVGINDYQGVANDLNGCVNDANDWANLLETKFGYETRMILDAEATCEEVKGALNELIVTARPGDSLVFTYSGHGTWVPDQGEEEESDNRDEALAVYDGIIIDDEIRNILVQLDTDVSLAIISDSCHSGSVTRSFLRNSANRARADENQDPRIPRFLPPEKDVDALKALMLPVRRRAFYPESSMNHVLLSGCNAMEYSYDATFGGRSNGAMSYFAMQLIQADPKRSWRELHTALRELLPSTRYPQSPQLEGSDTVKDLMVFT